MITIYLKTLTGNVETLEFPQDVVTISIIKLRLKKRGYITRLFRHSENSENSDDLKYDEKEDSKEHDKELDDKELDDDSFVKDGDVLYLFREREEFLPAENKAFEDSLKDRVHSFKKLRKIIIDNSAIIAGGSVLSIFGNYPINDLDIYVNFSNAEKLIRELYVFGFSAQSFHKAPAYDDSFFRKNNIMGRFYTIYNKSEFNFIRRNKVLEADIIVIPDHIPLENVVTNFDLTFCQVWWDGDKIHSFDVEDIRSKSGSLNQEYVSSYLNMNTFIMNRILKYRNRGFNIKIDISHVSENIVTKIKKTADPEIWAVTKIIDYIKEHFTGYEFYLFFDAFPKETTLTSLYEKIDKDVIDSFVIRCFYNIYDSIPANYRSYYKNTFSTIIGSNSTSRDVEHMQQHAWEILRLWINHKKDKYKISQDELRALRNEYREGCLEILRRNTVKRVEEYRTTRTQERYDS